MRAAGWIEFGQLTLSLHEVRPTEIDLEREIVEFSDPAALRDHIRRDPFRPLATSTDLPRDWVVRIDRRAQIHAVVETVYPGAVADWARRETLAVTPLEALAARQTGMYRQIDSFPPSTAPKSSPRSAGAAFASRRGSTASASRSPAPKPAISG